MHHQYQSAFYRLPPEVRFQIQTEYLAEYIRLAARSEILHYASPWEERVDLLIVKKGGCALSPLTTSCKRMYREIRGMEYQDKAASSAAEELPEEVLSPSHFAIFNVAPALVPGPRRLDRYKLAMEGVFDWARVRRLRFINELDQPKYSHWWSCLKFIIQKAPFLVEIELEWHPKMSFITDVFRDPGKIFGVSKSLRNVRLRGNVPLAWPGQIGALQGVRVYVEPLIWLWKEEAAEEEAELVESLAKSITRKNVEPAEKMHISRRIRWKKAMRPLLSWRSHESDA